MPSDSTISSSTSSLVPVEQLTLLAHIYIVRHGETAENRAGIIQGQLDTQLNDEGRRQAEKLGEAMKGVPLSRAWTSDLKRARDTAEIVLKHHPKVQLVVDEGLRERYMGSIQGTDYRRDKSKPPPDDCESSEVFTERTLGWWIGTLLQELRASVSGEGPNTVSLPAHILVVSHGAYIATLVRTLGYAGLVEVAPGSRIGGCWNTSVSVIEMYKERAEGRLVRWADIGHLLGAEKGERGRMGPDQEENTTKEGEQDAVDIVRIVADDQSGVGDSERG